MSSCACRYTPWLSPKKSTISAADQIMAMGLAIFWPKISGADPCTGSNSEGHCRVGLRFAEGATPIVPVQAGPKSDKISPNKLVATTTSKNRSEEHTSELQSRGHLVCRLL